MATTTKLYINKVCPFAQRAMIVAAHKNFNAETIEISLSEMPDFYKAINPREEVPALQLPNGIALSESALIAQYIDDATEPKSSLFAPSADLRQKIREFNRGVEDAQWACYGALMAQPEEVNAKVEACREALKAASELMSTTSDFAVGSTFTIADVLFVPFMLRFGYTLKAYTSLDIRAEFPRIAAFIDQCLTIPAVASTTPPPEYFISGYKSYANGKPNNWKYKILRGVNCPFSERVELAWAAVNHGPNTPAYLKQQDYLITETVDDLSTVADLPTMTLPCGRVITSSIEAVTFLAERFTEAGLIPTEPEEVFAGRWFVDTCGRVTDEVIGKILAKSRDLTIEGGAATELTRADKLFGSSPKGGPYMFGAQPTAYDLIVIPIFHRVELLMGPAGLSAVAPNIAAAVGAARADAVLGPKLISAEAFFSSK